ncbi:MAG: hypothetical protein HY700_11950 [Gemmatimonadetes bacterium]|nr:hypothetical protein [Gemmatimonadota bacterium]
MLLAAAIGSNACRESASAPATLSLDAGAPLHLVRWSGAGSPRFAFVRSGSARPAAAGVAAAAATSSTFWAYTDKDASLTVNVLASDGTWQPFATITVPRGALLQRPDGSLFLGRDSIAITLTPDTASLAVELHPSGLVFNPLVPAQLSISYGEANPDFNRDGVLDSTDEYIKQVLLGVATRNGPLDPWSAIPSINDLVNQRVASDLYHFTGYAVSW